MYSLVIFKTKSEKEKRKEKKESYADPIHVSISHWRLEK
jgi:hypothetical protein